MGLRRTRPLAVACALALLGACQTPQNGVVTRLLAPTFRMQAADGAVAGRAAVTVTPAGAAAGSTAGQARPTYDGELTVKFAHLLGDRKLMATVDDVDTLTITLAGNGVNHTETITHAMITGGMTSFTFSGLPAGSLTVTIHALDGTGKIIGTDIQQATVTAGQTTVVASTVMIAPTVTQPQIIVTGGSGGSGGATGSLTTTVTLVDGAPVQNAALLAAYTNDGAPHAVSLVKDNQGNMWFTGGKDFATYAALGALKRVTPGGTVSTIDVGGAGAYGLGTKADGSRIYVTSATTNVSGNPGARQAFAPDGSPVTIPGWPDWIFGPAVAGANDDTVYIAGFDRYAMSWLASGSFGFAEPFDFGTAIRVTSTGDAVYTYPKMHLDPNDGRIIRFQSDGTRVFDYPLTEDGDALTIALDAQDNVWFARPSQPAINKLSPTGTLLGSYPLPVRANATTVDALGRVWAYQSAHTIWATASGITIESGASDDLLMRLGADGRVAAFYHLGLGVDINDLLVTADDHLWVASPAKGLLHYTLPPAPSPAPSAAPTP